MFREKDVMACREQQAQPPCQSPGALYQTCTTPTQPTSDHTQRARGPMAVEREDIRDWGIRGRGRGGRGIKENESGPGNSTRSGAFR